MCIYPVCFQVKGLNKLLMRSVSIKSWMAKES